MLAPALLGKLGVQSHLEEPCLDRAPASTTALRIATLDQQTRPLYKSLMAHLSRSPTYPALQRQTTPWGTLNSPLCEPPVHLQCPARVH